MFAVVPQDFQDQALPRQEAETKQAHSSVDQNEDWKQDQVSSYSVVLYTTSCTRYCLIYCSSCTRCREACKSAHVDSVHGKVYLDPDVHSCLHSFASLYALFQLYNIQNVPHSISFYNVC